MEFTNTELARAGEIWREAETQEPNDLLWAMRVFRSWRVGVKAEMRAQHRNSEKYRQLKELEEGLEAKIIDLRDAWMTELSDRRNGG